jgi:hypothetical protein
MRCGKLHVPAAKQDPQGYGSALTYCRRYSLMTACGIAPEDDDGNAASKPVAKPEPKADKLPDSSINMWLSTISDSQTIEQLREATKAAMKVAADAGDAVARNRFKDHGAIKSQQFEGLQA